jgi:DNA-binding HxlR family transcriptional regulator
MAKRSYGQYCPIAHSLDLLGERWTLLIVRDLLLGPRRYGDLLAGLSGMSTDLLADRLRALEDARVVQRRRLAPPAGATVYELTEHGEELRTVLSALARWGAPHLPPLGDTDDRIDHRWALLSMAAGYHGPGDHTEAYQLIIDDEPFALTVVDGTARVRRGECPEPAVAVRTDAASFLALASGAVTASAAQRGHLVELEGDRTAFTRLIREFGLTIAS